MNSYGRTPSLMPIFTDRPTLLGRGSQSVQPDYVLESTAQAMMPSRLHARLHPRPDGGVDIEDLSVNGTYLNFTRIAKLERVKLTEGAVLAFGHRNGMNIKPGEFVPTFRSELKFVFESATAHRNQPDEISAPAADPTAAAAPSPPGAAAPPPPAAAAPPPPAAAVAVQPSTDSEAPICGFKRQLSDNPQDQTELAVKRPRTMAHDEAADVNEATIQPAPLTPRPLNSLPAPVIGTPPSVLKLPKFNGPGTPGSGSQNRRRGRKSRQPRQQRPPMTPVAITTAAAIAAANLSAAAAAADAQSDEGPCALGAECGLPVGPNLMWVGCDRCLAWFHAKCTYLAGCSEEELAAADFVCNRCR